jgi:Zn-dependent protease
MTSPFFAGPGARVRCEECGADIAAGLLACPGCSRLVYGRELAELARTAEAAEHVGDRTTAITSWRRALDLLPPGTTQRATIDKRVQALSAAIDGRAPADGDRGKSGGKNGAKTAAGTAGVVGLALLKSKALLALLLSNGKLLLLGLTKVPTLLSMFFYAGFTGNSAGIAIGVVASMYVHEIGHVAALKRFGIESTAPMFVPGFGAFVRLKQYPASEHEDARVGLAGPLWGLFAACVAAVIGFAGKSEAALAVAAWAARLNLFNLLPVWQLDGSRGLRALARGERLVLAAIAAAVAISLHQWMPGAVGAVILGRAFIGESHPTGDRHMLALFAVLIVAHAALSTLGSWGF